MDHALGPADRARLKAGTEEDLFRLHHGFANWIRTEWGLWNDSPLAKWFQARGVKHPDDMSMIVLRAWWRKAHGKPVDLDGQIARTVAWWRRAEAQHPARVLRARQAALEVGPRMLGWTTAWRATPYVVFPEARSEHHVRAFTRHAGGTLVAVAQTDPGRVAFFRQPDGDATLAPVSVPELQRIDSVVRLADALLVAGVRAGGKGAVIRIAGKTREVLPAPPGAPPLRLVAGASAPRILAAETLAELRDGTWKVVQTWPAPLPITARMPHQIGDRILLGPAQGDVVVWQWLEPQATSPRPVLAASGLDGLFRDTTMHGVLRDGERAWVTVAGRIEPSTLLRVSSDGVRVAVFEGTTTLEPLDPDTIPSEAERQATSRLHVTALARAGDDLYLAGATGLLRVRGGRVEPLVSFRGLGDRRVEHLAILSPDRFLLGASNGGVFVLKRLRGEDWVLEPARPAKAGRL